MLLMWLVNIINLLFIFRLMISSVSRRLETHIYKIETIVTTIIKKRSNMNKLLLQVAF